MSRGPPLRIALLAVIMIPVSGFSATQGAGEFLLRHLPGGSDAARQREVLRETAHRPWPLPSSPWFMGQTWLDLLFAHWRVDPEALRRVMPPQLSPQTYDGSAWLGVSPFVIRGLRLRGSPPPPLLSGFPEINVRTYVSVGGKPGIYFFSLDAASRAAVFAARRAYKLPYFHSEIAAGEGARDSVHYRARRLSADGPSAEFDATYRPIAKPYRADPGSLAHFLAERYCLYTLDGRGRIHRADIHHPPWPLQAAALELEANTMTAGLDIELTGDPVLHFSRRQDVVIWRLAPAEET
jgi:uncharacterized protein YqjF (DUF2071 family)